MSLSPEMKTIYERNTEGKTVLYKPEGQLINTQHNRDALVSPEELRDAMTRGEVLEARVVLCDNGHNLHVDLGCMRGVIPREEGALGIDDGTVRDIALISRVNKPVIFKIIGFDTDAGGRTRAVLSRRSVQKDCVDRYVREMVPGDVIGARVTHLESFGAFADIGAGVTALLPIDSISVSRIPHPNVRFTTGQDIRAVVRSVDAQGRVTLTHRELLGTWEQNAAEFEPGQTVPGVVRSVEKYGVFVELMPNLAGLAEFAQNIAPGQIASVYIKSILPERMKIKLIIVDAFNEPLEPSPLRYFTDCAHMDRWVYSPESCDKVVESVFSEQTDDAT